MTTEFSANDEQAAVASILRSGPSTLQNKLYGEKRTDVRSSFNKYLCLSGVGCKTGGLLPLKGRVAPRRAGLRNLQIAYCISFLQCSNPPDFAGRLLKSTTPSSSELHVHIFALDDFGLSKFREMGPFFREASNIAGKRLQVTNTTGKKLLPSVFRDAQGVDLAETHRQVGTYAEKVKILSPIAKTGDIGLRIYCAVRFFTLKASVAIPPL